MRKLSGGFVAAVLLGIAVVYFLKGASERRPGGTEALSAPSVPSSFAPEAPKAREPAQAPAPRGSGSPADRAQLQTLNEILDAKNDNDPRLDTELRILGPHAKRLFRDRYADLKPEQRNERGTIVFLLGRNLGSEEDFRFLEDVLREPPCRSLADCSQFPASPGREQLHDEVGTELTLSYPQVVALQMSERDLNDPKATPDQKALARRNLETGERSPVATVRRMAKEMLARHPR